MAISMFDVEASGGRASVNLDGVPEPCFGPCIILRVKRNAPTLGSPIRMRFASTSRSPTTTSEVRKAG